MTDKEKILVKIESLLNETNYEPFTDEVFGKIQLLKELKSYIDSLQEEPVAPKVLEDMLNAKTAAESLGISQEEHDRIVDELIYGKKPELVDVDNLPNKEEEPVSEDLEEASRKYADNEEYGDDVYFAIKAAFKEGAQWQKANLWKPADGDDLKDET